MPFRNGVVNLWDDSQDIFSRLLRRTNSFHPLMFGHVLIRLGYEPHGPTLCHTPLSFMGLSKPVYMYPWIGKYIWNLIRDIGFLKVCTTGFACSWISNALMIAAEENAVKCINRARESKNISPATSVESSEITEVTEISDSQSQMDSHIAPPNNPRLHRQSSLVWALRSLNNVNDVEAMRPEYEEFSDVIDLLCEEKSIPKFVTQFAQILIWRLYGIIISQPFRVIVVRQIAYAAAGGDKPYGWFPQAALQIYRENGLLGFFQGLLPNLISEVLILSSVINIHRLIRLYLLDNCDISFSHLVRSILWIFHNHYIREPLLTVGDLLAVRGSGLNLPVDRMEIQSPKWSTCWDYLVSTNQILRASSWYFRQRVPTRVIEKMQS